MPPKNKQTAITVLLAMFCLAMAVVLALEWLNPPSRDKNFGVTPPPSQEPVLDIDASAILEVPLLSRYSEIVERPLFLSSRRPSEEPEVIEPEIAQEEPQFTLLGVLLTPERVTALLKLGENGNIVRLALGETVKGWKLTTARANGITLRKSESVMDLPLLRNRPVPQRVRNPRRSQEVEALKTAINSEDSTSIQTEENEEEVPQ